MMRVLMTRLLASVLALLLIWQPAVAGITYYHNDALGSPVAATDENGKLLWREAYAPFGEKLNNSPAQRDSRIAYTGKLHDDDTGLTYMNARYYDPVVGRFMAIDPVGPLQGGLEHINRYDYAYNNPYKYIDSTGLYPTCDCKDDKTYEGVNESMKGNLSRTEKKSGGFGDIIAHVPIYNNLEIMENKR
ncbi:RHS repeat domain-containing protein [Pokkaliibacter plantistimulans]|uniref:RHS repeat domain-containing protein n=1 Tax=Pokkaliibacter plantistimulans TaxID=1635171 RepID=UPI00398F9316